MKSPLFTALSLFLTLVGALWILAYRLVIRPEQLRVRIGERMVIDRVVVPARPLRQRVTDFLRYLGEVLPVGRNIRELKQNLVTAGYRSESAVNLFLGVQVMALVLFAAGGGLLMFATQQKSMLARIMIVIAFGGVGWRIPAFLLKKAVAGRKARLRRALPDVLDLIIIAVEAGLGLDQSIQHVAHELADGEHRELAADLQLVGMEMQAGMRRSDALRAFGERSGEEEIQKLVALLVQNDQFGTSLGEAMRSHSGYLRVQRRQSSEEMAAKVGVKLVFPIFFFILPSMMLIAAGPGILQIFKYLFPMMNTLK